MLYFILGFILGWIVHFTLVFYKAYKFIKASKAQQEEQAPLKVDVDFVRENNKIYAYRRDDESFLAHGETKEEIVKVLQQRFPHISFMASSKNLKDVGLE
jgi:hypothetical protein